MNSVKRYPEAHNAWLYAMGIDVRWRHRSAQEAVDAALTLAPAQSVDVHSKEYTSAILPELITQARYWVVGEHALTQKQAYLLSGMLSAIGVDAADCVYSYPSDAPAREQRIATGLLAWPELTVTTLSAEQLSASVEMLECTTRIVLGTVLATDNLHERQLHVPSLQAMIDQPELKKDAWAVIKNLRRL